METQIIDSSSGTVMAELVAGSRGGMLEVTKVWTRWSQVEVGFKNWAEKLRSALEEAQKGL